MLICWIVVSDAAPVIMNARWTTTSAPRNASSSAGRVADVAPSIGHLRPAVFVRIERSAGDPDDPSDPLVGLQQRHKAEAKRAGRTSNRDCEIGLGNGANPP